MIITLPETNSSHLNIDGWKMSFLLGWPIFRGELLVSGSVLLYCYYVGIAKNPATVGKQSSLF